MGLLEKCPCGNEGNKMDSQKLGGAPMMSAIIVLIAVLFLGGVHFAFSGSVNF